MKDTIFDVVRATAGLGFFDAIKVTVTDTEATIDTIDANQTIVVKGTLNGVNADMIGEYGMGNLPFLNGLCNLYNKEGSEITVERKQRNGVEVPEYFVFKDAEGNTDRYRLMGKNIVDQQVQTVKFKGAKWDVSFQPTKAKVQEMTQKAAVYGSIEPMFSMKSDGQDLIVQFGSDAGGGHFGKMVLAPGGGSGMKDGWAWPLDKFLAVLKHGMAGECTVQLSNQGAAMITVDTGMGKFDYILPGHAK